MSRTQVEKKGDSVQWCSYWCPQGTLLFLGHFSHTNTPCTTVQDLKAGTDIYLTVGHMLPSTKSTRSLSFGLYSRFLSVEMCKNLSWLANLSLQMWTHLQLLKRKVTVHCNQSSTKTNENVKLKCHTRRYQAACAYEEREGREAELHGCIFVLNRGAGANKVIENTDVSIWHNPLVYSYVTRSQWAK